MNSRSVNNNKIFGSIFILISIFFLTWSVKNFSDNMSNQIETTGKIVDIKMIQTGKPRSTKYRPIISFTTNNKENITFEEKYLLQKDQPIYIKIGSAVRISYNSLNPSKAHIYQKSNIPLWTTIILQSISAVLLFLFSLLFFKKSRRHLKTSGYAVGKISG